jgi:hypothetical protein
VEWSRVDTDGTVACVTGFFGFERLGFMSYYSEFLSMESGGHSKV